MISFVENGIRTADDEYDEARELMESADSARSYLKRFGRNAAVLSHLGNACLDLKEYRKAERAFRDAAALEPDVAGHHFNIVMLSILRGDEATKSSPTP